MEVRDLKKRMGEGDLRIFQNQIEGWAFAFNEYSYFRISYYKYVNEFCV